MSVVNCSKNLKIVLIALIVTGIVGVLTACDNDNGGITWINEPDPEKENPTMYGPDNDYLGTWADIPAAGYTISDADYDNNFLFYGYEDQKDVDRYVENAVTAVTTEVNKVRLLLDAYKIDQNSILQNPKSVYGIPTAEFTEAVRDFNAQAFGYGHINNKYGGLRTFDIMLDAIFATGNIANKDKDLFTAYVNAYRGRNFISSRHRLADDDVDDLYTTPIDLALGNGNVTIEELFSAVNNEGGDLPLSGDFPTNASMRTAIEALLIDEGTHPTGTPDLIKRVIVEIGNFEQLLGMLERIQSVGKSTIFTLDLNYAINQATGGKMNGDLVTIDGSRPNVAP